MSQPRTAPEKPPRLEFRVPPESSHLLRARERLRDYLGQYCTERDLVEDVVLCVEEACTNAIRHSGSAADITIALEFADGRLVATVRDRGHGFDVTGFDAHALPDLTADHGRGLFIICSLMDDVELCCHAGFEVCMTRSAVTRCEVEPLESGFGELRATVRSGQRENRLRALLEEIDEAFVAVDWEYRCVHANGAALQLADASLDEMLGKRPWELFADLAGSALERAYRDAMELGKPGTIELCLAASGAWLEVRVYPTPAGVSAYFRRIDERKRTEQDRERLLEAYELELSRTALLGDVARAAAGSLGLGEICERVLEQIHVHSDLRAASIHIADRERGVLHALALFGCPDDLASELRELPLSDESSAGRILLHDLPQLTSEDDGPPPAHLDELAGGDGCRWLSLPITHQGETLGAMTLVSAVPGGLERDNVELYRSVAATIGTAMANARSYQAEVDALRRYELLAAEARDVMLFVRQRDGRILEANRAAEQMYGYGRDELLRLTIRDLRAEETREQAVDQMATAASQGILFETLHRRSDGSTFPVEVSSRGTTAMAGEVVLLSVVREITKRRAAEAALRESEGRYRGLVDLSPEAILVNAGDRYVFANPAAAQLLGAASPDDLTGTPAMDLIHPDDRETAARRMAQALRGEVTPLARMRWLRLDGVAIDVEATGTRVEFAGKPAIQVVVRDIAERVHAEAVAALQNRVMSGATTILEAALTSRTEEELGQICLRVAEEVTESRFGFIGEIGPDRLHHDIAMSDPGSELCEMYDKSGHRGALSLEGLYGRVLAEGRSVLANAPAEHPLSIGTPPGHPPLTAFLGVPLKRGGRTVGLIAMGNREGGYGEDQRRALESLAPAMAQAFDRKRAEAAQRDSERRATAELSLSNTLLRAAETLSSSMQIDTLLDRLAELLVDAVGAGRLVVLLWDHAKDELSVALSKGGESFPTGTAWSRDRLRGNPLVSRWLTDHRVRTIDFELAEIPPEIREVTAQIGMRLALAVPIVAKGELFGYVGLDERGARREFGGREIGLAKAICDQAAAALDNARLYQQEHDVAQALRAALLKLPDEIPGLTFAHHYRPAVRPAHVGGDFYDIFELAHGLVGVVVGDISGKGIEAAVLTSLVKNTIRAHATEKGKTPAEVVALTNTVLARETAAETFATVFFAMLDRRDGRLVYCNAGHPASVVARRDAGVAVLPATSPLIGAFAEFSYANAEAFLSCDDLLFLYTDGLTDARHGQDLFGEHRLFDMIDRLSAQPPGEIVAEVIDGAVSFARGGLRDDLAVLALRRHELPGPSQQKMRLG